MKYNDLDLKNWQELDINTELFHGLLVKEIKLVNIKMYIMVILLPQIPNQLIQRYTKKNDIVLEPFMGSGTTLFECEKLNRKIYRL